MNAPRRVTLLARRATVLFEQLVNKIPPGAEMIGALRGVCAGLPDQRKDPRRDGDYSMADIGLAAFSIFFMGSPSSLGINERWQRGTAGQTARRCSAWRRSPPTTTCA
jgi:hypothetical protein